MRDRSNNPSHHRATYHTYLHKNNKTAPRGIDPTTHQFLSMLLTEREREMFYLTTHSTHFIYGYMASDIWLRTILIVRKETRCRHIGFSYRLTARVLLYAPSHRQDNTFHGRHIGYSYRLTARVLLYAPSHRQDNTYHGLCYTSRGALAGTRNREYTKIQHSNLSDHS